MKTLGIAILVIAVLAILWFGYKYLSKPAEGTGCSTKGDNIKDGIIIGGACVKTEDLGDTSNVDAPIGVITDDYFVNGDDAHDRDVFSKGLECAKAFLYTNNSNAMSNAVNALLGRGNVGSGPCSGFDCPLASKINGLNPNDKGLLIVYVNGLNADALSRDQIATWRKFRALAVGRKNMCSVILEQAVMARLPGLWATHGRG